jgi:hypothetical protein
MPFLSLPPCIPALLLYLGPAKHHTLEAVLVLGDFSHRELIEFERKRERSKRKACGRAGQKEKATLLQ